MNSVNELYKAEASNLIDLALLRNGNVGFRVPIYQRQYDWSKDDITRLFSGSLNGLSRLPTSNGDANALTFLGTLILLRDPKRDPDFAGESLAIIDGQQRLTTLALFACALCESLRVQHSQADLSVLDNETRSWLDSEVEDRLLALHLCAIGSQTVGATKTYPFPRIVRHEDIRGRTYQTSEYRSPVARFLKSFSTYLDGPVSPLTVPEWNAQSQADDLRDKKLRANFEIIRNLMTSLHDPNWYDEQECEMFDTALIERGPCRSLLSRLPEANEGINPDRILATVQNVDDLHELIRTLVFSAYFCDCIVLTRVTTEDEDAAFDIFDSLNTTGIPLTAIETLKPRVISFEGRSREGYDGSLPESHFRQLDENIDGRFTSTTARQNESKELIVTFRLYMEGRKLGKDLSSQRGFLRTAYDQASKRGPDCARRFTRLLADVSTFRTAYWDTSGIKNDLHNYHGDSSLDTVRLFMSFIRDMKTSLALPIVARYWVPDLKAQGDSQFVRAVRAVVAFLVIRRAWTGGTAGVDADLRNIMEKIKLSAGVTERRTLPELPQLRAGLKAFLTNKDVPLDRDRWVTVVAGQPLYEHSRELVRFMNFAAAHQSLPSIESKGTWQRDGVRESINERDYLSYTSWTGNYYKTVEHVAPAEEPSKGWSPDLYRDNRLRHSIGNLVMLPARENAGIGNAEWDKKRLFYLAVTETKEDKQREWIEQAKESGIAFGTGTTELLEKGYRLSLLDPIRYVDNWDEDLVLRRGKSIAGLCWDLVWPWLQPDS